jgi:hypothetical protein
VLCRCEQKCSEAEFFSFSEQAVDGSQNKLQSGLKAGINIKAKAEYLYSSYKCRKRKRIVLLLPLEKELQE